MAKRLSGWRKLAAATWGRPGDPQFYGDLELDAAALLGFVEETERLTGVRLTMTHLVGRAIAHGLTAVPQLRVRVARGRVHRRETVDVFFIMAMEGELTGVKVHGADAKSAVEIARELRGRVGAIRGGEDAELGRGKAVMERIPRPLLGPALRLAAWLTADLNMDLSRFGMPRQAFGGAMVSSIGMWGIERAYSPLAPYYRVPVLVLVGAVRPKPVVVAGEVVARPVLPLTATFDHRYTDGYHAARFAEAIREYCADPAAFELAPQGAAGEEPAPGAGDGAPA